MSSKAHPANRPLHKLPSYAPSRRHSHNEHVQNGICAEFDNVGIVRLDDPVKKKLGRPDLIMEDKSTFLLICCNGRSEC